MGEAALPERVIGMHFFNPVHVMNIVEVISGLRTSNGTIDKTLALCKQMGKEVAVAKDSPGFISNRLLMPYINEAVQTLGEGLATKEDIDKVMKLGTRVPMVRKAGDASNCFWK